MLVITLPRNGLFRQVQVLMPPGKARKTASKKGARRLVDDEAAAEDADGWTRETVELD